METVLIHKIAWPQVRILLISLLGCLDLPTIVLLFRQVVIGNEVVKRSRDEYVL